MNIDLDLNIQDGHFSISNICINEIISSKAKQVFQSSILRNFMAMDREYLTLTNVNYKSDAWYCNLIFEYDILIMIELFLAKIASMEAREIFLGHNKFLALNFGPPTVSDASKFMYINKWGRIGSYFDEKGISSSILISWNK